MSVKLHWAQGNPPAPPHPYNVELAYFDCLIEASWSWRMPLSAEKRTRVCYLISVHTAKH